ncbi:MAG: class II aldolase/adducin family protein [Deltaproteobacteria bacterium]|nr:class II aldolase/adducin family protein [Deltaproteobacteria bacterium]
MDNLNYLKEKLYQACRLLSIEGMTNTGRGHLAVRVPGKDAMILPGHLHDLGRGLDHIVREDMVMIDFDGNVLEGHHDESMGEFYMYAAVFRKRPEINACLHAHPFYASVMMATKSELLPVSRDACLFMDGVPYYERFPLYIGTREHGEATAECLGNCKALFHRGHGVLVVGKSIEEAFVTMTFLDNACRIQVSAAAMGPLVLLDKDEARKYYSELDDDKAAEIFGYLRTRAGL